MRLLRASWTIARKDLRVYFRDRTGMLLGFGLPVVLVLAFGFIYKMTFGAPGGLSRTTLWVTDEDDSAASRGFLERLRAADLLAVRPRTNEPRRPREELRALVEDGEAHHALVIEAGFEQTLREERIPELTMYRDPDRDMESQLVSIGLLQAFVSGDAGELAPLLTARALKLGGLPEAWSDRILDLSRGFSDSIEALFGQAQDLGLLEEEDPKPDDTDQADGGLGFGTIMSRLVPVNDVDIKPPARPKQLSFMLAHNISGISVMMLMFGLVACGTMLIQEREQGTMARLLMAAVPRESLLFGKFLFTAVVGACQLAVMFTVGALVFQVNLIRDPVTLLVLCLALIFAVTAFGMLIAAFARTTKQAEGSATLIILVMSALGGAWFPVQMFDLPTAGAIAARCTLTWWAMSGFQGMLWYGKTWTDPGVLRDVGVLLAFGAAASLIAVRLFRRRFVDR